MGPGCCPLDGLAVANSAIKATTATDLKRKVPGLKLSTPSGEIRYGHSRKIAWAACLRLRKISRARQALPRSLHETDVGRRSGRRRLANFAKLSFVAADVFPQRPPQPPGVAGTDDHAGDQLAVRPVGEQVDKMERELLGIVMNHHQIAVLSEELFLVGFDLHLRAALRFGHGAPPRIRLGHAITKHPVVDGAAHFFRNEVFRAGEPDSPPYLRPRTLSLVY